MITSRELAATLMARTRWSADRLAAHQREQLDGLLREAVARSPYYRRLLGADAAGGGVPLRELPTLSKATLMERFDEIVTDDHLRLSAAEARIAGTRGPGSQGTGTQEGEAGDRDGYRVFATSGTTGRRGIFAYSRAEFTTWVAALLRSLLVMGATPEMRVASIGAPSALHISRQMLDEISSGGAPDLSVTTPLPTMVAELNTSPPDAIATYASTAALLAEEQLAGRLRIAPALVATGAEMLTGEMRQRIRDAWGIEPHQAYLSTEVPLLASTGASQDTLHLWEDLTLVEVVGDRGQPVPPGVPGHKVLVTNLVNRTQPLIRYELTDSVTLSAGPDPAGLPFRRLAAIEGRSDDTITLPAERGGTVAVHPMRLRAPFTACRDVVQYQITHADGRLAVRIVARADAAPDTAERVRTALARALRDAGAVPPPVTVIPVPEISREGGHGAKFKLIRSV